MSDIMLSSTPSRYHVFDNLRAVRSSLYKRPRSTTVVMDANAASQEELMRRAPAVSNIVVGSPSTPTLPTEIWWRIIDFFQYDWSTLLACTAVCRAWHAQAQRYLAKGDKHAIVLSSRADVLLLSRCARARVLHTKAAQIHGDGHASLGHLETFVAMLSRQLSYLNELQIIHGTWRRSPLHQRVLFRCLSTFVGIRNLTLRDINFPSAMEFSSVLVALPNLCFLECVNISTKDKAYGRLSRMHLPPSPPLVYLRLGRVSGFDIHSFFRMMRLQSDVIEVVIPDPDTSVSSSSTARSEMKPAMDLFRSPLGRFILTIHDKLASYDLLKQCCTEVLHHNPDPSVQNLSIKAASRADPALELPFLFSVLSSVISTLTGRVAIVGLVEADKPYGDWAREDYLGRLHLPFQWRHDPCPMPWDPEEIIISVQHFQPSKFWRSLDRSVSYTVILNIPLWECRSRTSIRDSWHQDAERYMESMPGPKRSWSHVQFYERTI
ncbi:hypothetical protein C8Q72DRAFT_418113 [Fomitopsis betulina]|nr:hypothetical protein C8Q72DRAFT_418113 [Fomitopsis betulina]